MSNDSKDRKQGPRYRLTKADGTVYTYNTKKEMGEKAGIPPHLVSSIIANKLKLQDGSTLEVLRTPRVKVAIELDEYTTKLIYERAEVMGQSVTKTIRDAVILGMISLTAE